MKQANSSYDLVIAGAGFAGLSLAVACQTALGPLFRILVVDPSPGNLAPHRDRASAIAADGKRLFVALGVWEAIEPHAQPIRAMIITDSKVTDPIRPRFLTFDETSPGAALAHMIEHDVLLEALLMRVQTLGVCVEQNRVETFKADAHGVSIQLSSGEALTARLLVAADGARSRLREQAGLPTSQWHYGQSAIVATIHHERDHEGRAYEHFLPSGPFAILPLTGRRSSIVWTESAHRAERLVELDDLSFHEELETRFGRQLGAIEAVGRRAAFPLQLKLARRFVDERLALIGDAAHVIHPLAGQGLNLGLRDVAALAECVIDTARLGLDVGGSEGLERYQRWRRFDTVAMGLTTESLNRLFSNGSSPLRFLRDVGLGIVDRLPGAKQFLMHSAAGGDEAGGRSPMPRLMQ